MMLRQELVYEKKEKDNVKEEDKRLTMPNVIKLLRTTKVQKCEGVFALGHKRCAIGLIYEHFFNAPEHILEQNSCGSIDDHVRLTTFFHDHGLTTLEVMSCNDHHYITFKDVARTLARVYQYRQRHPGTTFHLSLT